MQASWLRAAWLVLAALAARGEVRKDIVYAKAPEHELLLDLYLPDGGTPPYPLVIWVHGGGWRGGNKNNPPARFLVEDGYAVASIAYRLSGVAKFPAQIEDSKAAVRWLRANAAAHKLDTKRIGVWGASAGGHLVALLGTSGGVKEFDRAHGNPKQSSRVQAVVDYFGPTDFLKIGDFPSKINHYAADSPESLLLGGPVKENPEKAARANPITYVNRGDPPFLIVHGDQDPLVPLNQSELLEAALKKARVPVELVVLKGAGHGGKEFQTPEIREKIRRFFDQHVRGKRK